jgi:hypothetical protein
MLRVGMGSSVGELERIKGREERMSTSFDFNSVEESVQCSWRHPTPL